MPVSAGGSVDDGAVASEVCTSSRRDDLVENERLEASRVAIDELAFLRHREQVLNGRRAELTEAMVLSMYLSVFRSSYGLF